MKTQVLLSGLMICVLGNIAQAEETSSLELKGYLDFYYQASPQGHYVTTNGPRVIEGKYFDRHVNQMTLSMAEISVKKTLGKVTLKTDLAFGEMVDQLSGGGSQSNPTNTAANEPTRNVTQAYISYAVNERLSLNVGKFYTPMGFEVVKSKDNWQYSRGYLFNYGVPFWHEGLSVSYAIIPKDFSTTVYVLNSWDGRISQEQNESTTLGLNLNYTGLENISINYNYIGGAESNNTGTREVHEVNGSYQINETYALGVDAILGSQKEVTALGEARWNAYAIYFKATVNDIYSISPRFEVFDDSDQGFAISGGLSAAGVKQKITSWTLTNSFNLGQGLESRLEIRNDQSSSDLYFKKSDGSATDVQQTYTVALLYSL